MKNRSTPVSHHHVAQTAFVECMTLEQFVLANQITTVGHLTAVLNVW